MAGSLATLTVAVLLHASVSVAAGDPPPAAADAPAMQPVGRTIVATLVTRGGEEVEGEVVAASGDGIVVMPQPPGEPRTLAWTDLSAEMTFRLWRQTRGETDARRWMELARVLRGMHDGAELSESALSVAVLLDADLQAEAEEVRKIAVPPAPAPKDAGGVSRWLGLPSLVPAAAAESPTWGDFPPEREPLYIAQAKAQAEAVGQRLGVRFTVVETEHFLYFTNVPPRETYHSPRLLDQMFDKACELYGLPRGTKLFKGKCPVYMFRAREELQRYAEVFGGPEWAAGFCQQSTDGDVRIVMFQGEDRGYTIQTMLHETAHGVNWRYRAPNFLPPWLEEGIAEWVASNTTGDFRYVKSKRWAGLQKVRETKRLGDVFFGRPEDGSPGLSEAWQYGIAYDMVSTLIAKDRAKFIAMVDDIKDGQDPAAALTQHFNVTLDAFIAKYGEGVGIRGLQR